LSENIPLGIQVKENASRENCQSAQNEGHSFLRPVRADNLPVRGKRFDGRPMQQKCDQM
jgi:hypothetical protein